MPAFTSSREKKLWIWSFVILITIFSSLFIGQPLLELLANQNVRAVFFLIGMFFAGIAILIHAIKTKPGKTEIAIWLGIAAVYTMFFLRLGMPERSHLFEYSILAILIHKAIIERIAQGKHIPKPALISFVLTFLLGVLDECVQIFLPDRVFDPVDIFFNGFVIFMAIGSYVILNWAKRKFNKK